MQQLALDVAAKDLKQEECDEYEALGEAITDLKRLDRYERRVWSAQKRQSTILSKCLSGNNLNSLSQL